MCIRDRIYTGKCESLFISITNSVFLHCTGTLNVPELIAGCPTIELDVPITYPLNIVVDLSLLLGVTSTLKKPEFSKLNNIFLTWYLPEVTATNPLPVFSLI